MNEINIYIYRKNKKMKDIEKMEYMKLVFEALKDNKRKFKLSSLFETINKEKFKTKENPINSIKKIGGVCYAYKNLELTLCLKNESDKLNISEKSIVSINNVTAYSNKQKEDIAYTVICNK